MVDGPSLAQSMNKFISSLLPANPTIPGSSMFAIVALILCTPLPVCQAQLHASFFTSAHSCDDLADEVGQLAEAGRLSLARSNAAKIVAERPDCEKNVARRYVEAADIVLASWPLGRTGSEEACVDKSHVAEPLPMLQVEPQRHLDSLHDMKPYEHKPCWYGNDDLSSAAERWDLCCSGYRVGRRHWRVKCCSISLLATHSKRSDGRTFGPCAKSCTCHGNRYCQTCTGIGKSKCREKQCSDWLILSRLQQPD